MPISADLRQYYGRAWRKDIRPRILGRAQDACECCGKPNHRLIWTLPGGRWYCRDWKRWRAPGTELVDLRPPRERGVFVDGPDMSMSFVPLPCRIVEIVITIAHVNQIPGDDRDDNLAALCQFCHLWHERMQHARNARVTRCIRKDSARPLLALVG